MISEAAPKPVDKLKFLVAPNIVEDLGVNLYTTLPKALVEFVANAYDADSRSVVITIPEDAIVEQSEILQAQLKRWRKENPDQSDEIPSHLQTIPAQFSIVIQDAGTGMSRDDLEQKFLVIGRRRRGGRGGEEYTPGGRAVMGRKGIGKLAGFGVAHQIVVESRCAGEGHATRIRLDFEDLQKVSDTRNVDIVAERCDDCCGILQSGTRITLSRLVFHAIQVKRRSKGAANAEPSILEDVRLALSEHFYAIDSKDFAIELNGSVVQPPHVEFEKAYPERDDLNHDALIEVPYQPEGSERSFPVRYRIRFRGKGGQLPAKQRGIRLYAHRRLAAAASLLDVGSATHGFGFTAYMDAIVVADFIDKRGADYISTDRSDIRWDSLLLGKLREFLTAEMEKALGVYADFKAEQKNQAVDNDKWTRDLIESANLPAHRRKIAERVAQILARADEDGVAGQFYRSALPSIVSGLGHGDILNALNKIANSEVPNLKQLIAEVTRLTAVEYDEFIGVVTGRIKAIEQLRRIVETTDRNAPKNENELHVLFENNPWLLDPTFFEFLQSDKTEDSLLRQLSRRLKVDDFVPEGYDPTALDEIVPFGTNLRPDLVFLLGSESLRKVVIVELKASNTPLHGAHAMQLIGYMENTRQFLATKYPGENYIVEGMLIGTLDDKSSAKEVTQLRGLMQMHMAQNSPWRVYDLSQLLRRTERAHHEILRAYQSAKKAAEVLPT